ncbi:MAG: cytochrome c biogenesis protein [Coriobacteriales bacterium]|jgi:heme exporter protein C|nr:cytochrome c biogenesis protein [Coriobacteriales bacterium]
MTQDTHSRALANRLAPVALVLGIVLTTVAFLLSFLVAPLVLGANVAQTAIIGGEAISNKLLLSQKIFYIHVPVATVSFGALAFLAYYSIRYLATKNQARKPFFDTRARIAAEVGLVFIIMTMLSGDLWTRFEWGVWWVWEPRLTTYLILMLLMIAYFILRTAIDAPERKATFAAVFGLIACVDAGISYLITRFVPTSIHPVIFRTDSGLSPSMLVPFLLALFGMALICFALYRLRLRQVELNQRLESLKLQLEEN